ncbi:hypothetical protein FS842_010848 [Serendipita sp. 407]|nr:hypothetical protein FS842_010848 [Serendipita sp. 407]
MSRKRKAESEQSSLFAFFDSRLGASSSTAISASTPKKKRVEDVSPSRNARPGSSIKAKPTADAKATPIRSNKPQIPTGTEVIEISDSDEDVPLTTGMPLTSPNRRQSSVEVTQARNGLVELSEDEEEDSRKDISSNLTEADGPLDFSNFFMESPIRPSKNHPENTIIPSSIEEYSLKSIILPEDNENESLVVQFDRLSPDRWAPMNMETLSETSSMVASEPEDEFFGKTVAAPIDEAPSPVEQLEPDQDKVELIDLSDDEDPNPSTSSAACPICQIDLGRVNELDRSQHVNRCLDMVEREPLSTSNHSTGRKADASGPSSSALISANQKSTGEQKSSEAPNKTLNAFSFLMSRTQESEAWKEATEAENSRWRKLDPKGKGKAKETASGGNSSERLVEEIVDDLDTDDRSLGLVKGSKAEVSGNNAARRPAPFYKVMQGMPIAVDAFRYGKIPGVTAYLLTHAHSDHYTNLSSSWKHGPIYCSETTAELIIHMLSVDREWVHPLPMNKATILPDTGGVTVTLIEANHCPGSCLFFFEGMQTVNAGDSTFHSAFVGTARIFRYLHCGDFRACPQHVMHPSIQGKRLDLIYLDTTYLDPKYCFPPQRMVIDACAGLASRIVQNGGDNGLLDASSSKMKNIVQGWLNGNSTDPDTPAVEPTAEVDPVLVVVGTYTIGKERIVKAISNALNTSIWCEPKKRKVYECQTSSDPELLTMIGNDPLRCGVHVRPLSDITSEGLLEYLDHWKGRWKKVVGFRPTGWTYTPPVGSDMSNLQIIIQRDQKRTYNWAHLKPMRSSTSSVMIYGVPYSEHSSFFELSCFALSISYTRMIATVNVGNAKSRTKMNQWFEKWEAEKKRRERDGKGSTVVHRHDEYW